MSQILHVVVVGFHHKKGCQVDFSYPPLQGSGEGGLPEEWINLPSLALPDGAHNSDSDIIYFSLPSAENPGETIFGISCYRQIRSSDLVAKDDHVTRSTVQKSVCVLTRSPMFGVLKAKLQLITQAYFNERDFAKVEVLSQMYSNLCEMFEEDLVDEQSASMDISVQELFIRFRHRALLLVKLLLLEKKVVFNITPAHLLGDTMISLLSLLPRLLEDGLLYSSCLSPSPTERSVEEIVVRDRSTSPAEDDNSDGEVHVAPSDNPLKEDPIKNHDSYGFPLCIFTNGNIFHPYLSIAYLDVIRSPCTRAFTIGATNALFVHRKELLDAVVTIDDVGNGQIDITNVELKRAATLTSADLRFSDYILKNIEVNGASAAFDGSDEWIRLQIRAYLLSLVSTVRSDLHAIVGDFGTSFVAAWRRTRNYQTWISGPYEDLTGSVPGHPFAGQIGLHDVILRMEHSVAGSDGARKALTALSATGKNLGETGYKVKQSLSNWFNKTPMPSVDGQPESNGRLQNADEFTGEATEVRPETISNESGNGTATGNRMKGLSSWFNRRRTEGVPEATEATECQDAESPPRDN